MELIIKMKKLSFSKIVWQSAKKDLFLGVPWLPIYSFSEVLLAICVAILLQLIFITNNKIEVASLIPGKLKNYITFNQTLDRNEIILIIPILIVATSLIKLISGFMSSYLTERAGHRVAHKLREEMLYGFLSSSGNKLDQKNPDYVANQMMQDTTLLQGAISKGTISALRDALVLIGIIISMLLISWETFIIGICVVVPFGILLRKISIKLNYYTREGQKKQIEISTRLLLTHHGSLTVHALRSQKREKDDFELLNSNNYNLMKQSLFVRTFFPSATEFSAICMVAIMFAWRLNFQGNFQAGTYSTMLILLAFSFRYIKNIAGTITFFSDIHVVLKRVNDYIQDYTESNAQQQLVNALPSYSQNAIIVENVTYHILDGSSHKEILTKCSLKIEQGKKIAFIGESGAGKTTLLRIIAGLITPQEGNVSVIPEFLLASQFPYIFRGTVKENIVYVKKDLPENMVEHNTKELVMGLMLAYSDLGANIFLDKHLGFLGDGLSGGEKARVSLARALFSAPKLLLLDEPSANLDAQSATLFWKAVENWKAKDSKNTVVAVSHALHEVLDFDYCYIFDQGKIVNMGVPKEILSKEHLHV
jgi:ABC-type multidrug transport system fused ATPase/permease subunit